MFKLSAESFITFIVDNHLVKPHSINCIELLTDGIKRREALYLRFSVNMEDYEIGKQKQCGIHMIFFGNVSVFYYIDYDNKFHNIPSPELFTNSCNHDSCWSADGLNFLNNLYFDMCREINPNKAPVKIDDRSSLTLWSCMKKVMVEYKKERDFPGKFKLTNIEIKGE